MFLRKRRPLGMCFFAGEAGSGDAAVAGSVGSESTTVSLNFGGSSGSEPNTTGDFTVPEAYKDKDWVKNLNSVDELFKLADNQNTLVGKKLIGIPTDISSPEEISAFNRAFGVPENKDGYEINQDDTFRKMYGDSVDEVTGAFKDAFYEARLNNKQASVLQTKYNNIINGIMEKLGADTQARNDEFEVLSEKTFGDKRDDILNSASKILKENTPEGFEKYVSALDNQSLMVLAGVLNNVKEKYINEDTLNSIGNPNIGNSVETIKNEISKNLSSDAFKNPLHAGNSDARTRHTELVGLLVKANQK